MKERPLAGVRLTPRNGLFDSTLAGGDFDEATITESRRWGNAMLAAARLHEVGKPNQYASRRLTHADAGRLLRIRLADLAKGGAQ